MLLRHTQLFLKCCPAEIGYEMTELILMEVSAIISYYQSIFKICAFFLSRYIKSILKMTKKQTNKQGMNERDI